MLHASSWLGYSWDLADLVYHGKDVAKGGRADVNRVSRREKFRSSAGPSREELQWLEILDILHKVSKSPVLLHAAEDYAIECSGALLKLSSKSSPFPEDLESDISETPVNGVDVLLSRCCEAKLKIMLQDVLWPFDAVGDITSMYSIEIKWEGIPSSADPVFGARYKIVGQGRRGGSKPMDRKSKKKNKLMNEAHRDHGDASLGRGERKRWQVEKIASVLKSFRLKPGARIVDFGCGSGALTLPLAAIFPELTFVGVDFKLQSIILLEERARKGNLQNVAGVYGRIENYSGSFDACVALHACGIATDLALLQAMKNRAAYIMSPCCIGKLQIPIQWLLNSTDSGISFKRFIWCNETPDSKLPSSVGERHAREAMLESHNSSRLPLPCLERDSNLSGCFDALGEGSAGPCIGNHRVSDDCRTRAGSELKVCRSSVEGWEGSVSSKLTYPRSNWLRDCVSEREFQVLARAADWSSYDFESFSSRLHSLCKVVLELDRNEASREVGYWTGLYTLSNEKAGTVGVSHVLVGKPQ